MCKWSNAVSCPIAGAFFNDFWHKTWNTVPVQLKMAFSTQIGDHGRIFAWKPQKNLKNIPLYIH
jgi:hypothetical protein